MGKEEFYLSFGSTYRAGHQEACGCLAPTADAQTVLSATCSVSKIVGFCVASRKPPQLHITLSPDQAFSVLPSLSLRHCCLCLLCDTPRPVSVFHLCPVTPSIRVCACLMLSFSLSLSLPPSSSLSASYPCHPIWFSVFLALLFTPVQSCSPPPLSSLPSRLPGPWA